MQAMRFFMDTHDRDHMAPDAVRRAHERVGLPYDATTEVTTATPGDMFFPRR